MLNATALSSFSGDLTTWSGEVDLEIIDRIIENAPRSATTFEQAYKAYCRVLQEYDLDPARDSAYYQFMLKLRVVRAPTWGERWDTWRTTHAQDTIRPRSPKLQLTDRLTNIKTRVPFLAGASSDLDDAYDRTYEGDEESVSSVGGVDRGSDESKEEVGSTSLVGHTPSPSVASEMDLLDLDPPLRSSTPVQPHKHHSASRRAVTPTPPPDSEADTTTSALYELQSAAMDDGSMVLDGASTPRAGHRSLDASFEAENDQGIFELDPMLAWKMERQADEFLRTGLLGRCWEVWAAQTRWILQTATQIETVRKQVLLRQYLSKWRQVHERHLDMANTADAHRRHALQAAVLKRWSRRVKEVSLARRETEWRETQVKQDMASAWKTWRVRLVQQRTDRWQRDMRDRERQFMREKHAALLLDGFEVWRERAREAAQSRVADAFHDDRLLLSTFEQWTESSLRKRMHTELLLTFSARQRSRDLARFTDWRRALSLGRTERAVAKAAEHRSLHQSFHQWHASSSDHRKAQKTREANLQRRALRTWLVRLERHKVDDRKAEEVASQRDQKVLRSCLHSWIASERGQLLRRVWDDRHVRQALAAIQSRMARVRTQEEQARVLSDKHDRHTVYKIFSRWREATSDQHTLQLRAELMYDNNRKKNALNKWTSAAAEARDRTEKADKAQVFFSLRTAWAAWKGTLALKRQEAWIRQKEQEDVREVFELWKLAVIRSIEDRQAIAAFQSKQDKRIMSATLARWTEIVVKVKSRELDITENRNQELMRDAMIRWTKAAARVRNAEALMRSFVDMRTEEHLRGCLLQWRIAAQSSRDRKAAAEEVEKRRDTRVIREAFVRWHDRSREKSLVTQEVDASNRHEDRLMFAVWDKWKARTTMLPPVQFDNTRKKREAWSRWRRALERAQSEKQVAQAKDKRLVEDVFVVWREAAAASSARRVRRVRERGRPVLPPPERPVRSSAAPPTHPPPPPIQSHLGHFRSASQTVRPSAKSPPAHVQRYAETTTSEPAYSRLRSELAKRRAGSEEPETPALLDDSGRVAADEGVIRALKGRLAR